MISPTTLITHKQDPNCCFWIKYSEACTHIKIGGVAIVAALAITALAAGILLALAQHGHQLAGINAIANMVEAKWLYLGLGVTGAVALIDANVIIALLRSFLNRTYSREE